MSIKALLVFQLLTKESYLLYGSIEIEVEEKTTTLSDNILYYELVPVLSNSELFDIIAKHANIDRDAIIEHQTKFLIKELSTGYYKN